MGVQNNSREAIIKDCFLQAKHFIEQRLGRSISGPNEIKIEDIESILDNLDSSCDPLDVLRTRDLFAVMQTYEPNIIEQIIDDDYRIEMEQAYRLILGNADVNRDIVFDLANLIVRNRRLFLNGCILICDGGDTEANQVISRWISYLAKQHSIEPVEINVSKELSGEDPLYTLDGLFPRVVSRPDDKASIDFITKKRSSLLLRDLPNTEKRAWIFNGVENLCVDIKDDARRSLNISQFWDYMAHFTISDKIRLVERQSNIHCREVTLEIKNVLFVLRTSKTGEIIKNHMKEEDWQRIKGKTYEFVPKPGIGGANI